MPFVPALPRGGVPVAKFRLCRLFRRARRCKVSLCGATGVFSFSFDTVSLYQASAIGHFLYNRLKRAPQRIGALRAPRGLPPWAYRNGFERWRRHVGNRLFSEED